MKTNELKPVFTEFIPNEIEEGILYISREHGTAISLCPCGCGRQAVIGLQPVFKGEWVLTERDGKVTVRPSLLNSCGAHYYITDNKIEWL